MKGFLIFLLAMITGCVSTQNKTSLHDVYNAYKSHATKDNILVIYKQYFSPRLVSEDTPDESSIPFLLFKNNMAKEEAHFAKILTPEKGCLTITGYDNEKGDPLEFRIQYVLIDNTWYMDGTNIRFLEDTSEYSKKATCPSNI